MKWRARPINALFQSIGESHCWYGGLIGAAD